MVQKLKVALLGAAGGIGQPLALLLKQNEVITELALYDIVTAVNGVAADLSHIDTPSEIFSYTKENDGLKKTLENADIVVIPAGVPRKPGMTRDDLFKINAGIVKDLATGIAENCPKAFVAVISNPVNSTVPIVAEVLKKKGVFDEKRIFGVTTLDVVRASTFTASAFSKPLESHTISIPVIGGHSGATIIPVLSQTKPKIGDFKTIDVAALVNRIQFGGDEVVKAKDGAGSATLSMAYAGYRFVKSLISAAYGGSPVVENTFIYVKNHSEVHKALGEEIDYFSVPVKLGPNGAEQVLPIGELDASEKELLKTALPELKASIVKGAEFTEAKL